MIYLEMAGRLGNQMFRYSFARKLSIMSKKELIIDFDRVYKKDEYKETAGWTNSLKLFKAKDFFYEKNNSKKEYFYKNANLMQLIVYFYFRIMSRLLKKNKSKLRKFQLKMQPLLNKYNLFFLELGYYNYDLSHLNSTKVIYVCGCFECSKYFDDIKDTIKDDLTPTKEIEEKNKELIKKINDTNSVCVTVRRGDFVENKKNSDIYNICDRKYFDKAVDIMIKKLKNPTFFIFSDDVEWAKQNINFQGYPVFSEDGTDSVDEKIRLMSSCKHFVISNSTFSWWAQYLSKNDNKIVISPNIWYKNNISSDLIEDDWIKIDVDRRVSENEKE